MRACQLLKREPRQNVSSLLEQRALVIPREYGIYGCELGFYIMRGKFLDCAESLGVNEPRSLTRPRVRKLSPTVDQQVGSRQ